MTSKTFDKKNYFSISKADVIFTQIQNKIFMLAKNRENKYHFYEMNVSAYFILKEMQKGVNFERLLKRCKDNFRMLSEKDIKEIKDFILKLKKVGIIKSRIRNKSG